MDAATTRALAETDRALARYRRRLSAVLRDLRGFAVTEAELAALGRESRSFMSASARLARTLPEAERTAHGRLRTARSGAKLWHGLIADYGAAMRTMAEGPSRDDSVVQDFVAQARLRRRFTRAAMARETRLKGLASALKGLRRRPAGGASGGDAPGPAAPEAPSE